MSIVCAKLHTTFLKKSVDKPVYRVYNIDNKEREKGIKKMKALEIVKKYMKAKEMSVEKIDENTIRVTLYNYNEDAWYDCEEVLEEMATENYSGETYRDYVFEDGELEVEFEWAEY